MATSHRTAHDPNMSHKLRAMLGQSPVQERFTGCKARIEASLYPLHVQYILISPPNTRTALCFDTNSSCNRMHAETFCQVNILQNLKENKYFGKTQTIEATHLIYRHHNGLYEGQLQCQAATVIQALYLH